MSPQHEEAGDMLTRPPRVSGEEPHFGYQLREAHPRLRGADLSTCLRLPHVVGSSPLTRGGRSRFSSGLEELVAGFGIALIRPV